MKSMRTSQTTPQVVLKSPILPLYYVHHFKATLSSLDSSSRLSSPEKRQYGGRMLDEGSRPGHMPSPLACSSSPAALPEPPGLSLCKFLASPPHTHVSLSIHYAIPSIMTLSQKQQCGVAARLQTFLEECNWAAFIFTSGKSDSGLQFVQIVAVINTVFLP